LYIHSSTQGTELGGDTFAVLGNGSATEGAPAGGWEGMERW
jgi:hypothetical protein